MKIPYMDLSLKQETDRKEILDAIEKVLIHGRILLGPEVTEFETDIARYCGTKYAIGTSSGTESLFMGMRALDIKAGDEVIVPAMSWIASANAVAMTGAKPVFADIGNDLNISVESIEKLITKKTKAILPVHFMGKAADMDTILKIAKAHNLLVIEDAAQAFGAEINGKKVGSFGHIGCFSMNSMKILPALGEAGVITTDNADSIERLKILRYAGMIDKIKCVEISLNGKIDTLQAAVLNVRLKKVDAVIKRRREIAKLYDESLKGLGILPSYSNNQGQNSHVYYGYTLLMKERAKFMEYMSANGIETKIQHWPLMPDQNVFGEQNPETYSNARVLVEKIVNIPNHENLTDTEVNYIAEKVKGFLK